MPTARPSPPGDPVEDLYREHGRALLGYALRRCAGREEALDLVSDVFVVVCRRPDQVPQDEDGRRPWLFGVARLTLANLQRSRVRSGRLGQRLAADLGGEADGVPDPAALLAARADARRVRQALAGLSDADRELLTLVAWEGLTPAGAATALGLAPGTARVRLHRARTRLRTALTRLDTDSDTAPEETP
ncbi:RNA polymerase sigma-70 factor, ECF subfamily [Geodermatophilus dictyosporus]|uniref:RNA polymerase sigma-70 factor, ECF subfamily n=1 Tax=Geodermatophilus dictyosporus TaxID=1523247 RepID=A0A1I5LIF5_9ACTN|nr:RNA polymerase sigma-70 factor, ECF subfamily [Geodermatophilus dictyosporus]